MLGSGYLNMPASCKKKSPTGVILPIMARLLCVRFQDFQRNLLSICERLAKYATRAALKKSKDLYPRRPCMETNLTEKKFTQSDPSQVFYSAYKTALLEYLDLSKLSY